MNAPRPQESIKAPRIKACALLASVALAGSLGFCSAEDGQISVVVPNSAIRAYSIIAPDGTTTKAVDRKAARGAIVGDEPVEGKVAVVALPAGRPVRQDAVAAAPVCQPTAQTSFAVVVVGLRAPAPSTLKKGTVIVLITSAPKPASHRATFLGAVDAPKDVGVAGGSVAYAEVLADAGVAAALGDSGTWGLVSAPSC